MIKVVTLQSKRNIHRMKPSLLLVTYSIVFVSLLAFLCRDHNWACNEEPVAETCELTISDMVSSSIAEEGTSNTSGKGQTYHLMCFYQYAGNSIVAQDMGKWMILCFLVLWGVNPIRYLLLDKYKKCIPYIHTGRFYIVALGKLLI